MEFDKINKNIFNLIIDVYNSNVFEIVLNYIEQIITTNIL